MPRKSSVHQLLKPDWLRQCVKQARVLRARAFQSVGSDRYNYPALNELDRQVITLLPSYGTFLEIGANDGYNQSNTYHLEAWRGWRGILIEPVPRLYRACARARPESECFNVACVADPELTEITLADADLETSAPGLRDGDDKTDRPVNGKTFTTQATLLSSVIDRSSFDYIDFMSIDVEGAELAVLGGLDFDRHIPSFLLVETKLPEKVDDLLAGVMRRTHQLSFHDFLWERINDNLDTS